jgi:endonuclease YncB( thermonuclease family)
VGYRNVDVGEVMVKKVMAWVFDKYANGYGRLYPMQAAAQASRVGLWADTEPMAPLDWRKAQKEAPTAFD